MDGARFRLDKGHCCGGLSKARVRGTPCGFVYQCNIYAGLRWGLTTQKLASGCDPGPKHVLLGMREPSMKTTIFRRCSYWNDILVNLYVDESGCQVHLL